MKFGIQLELLTGMDSQGNTAVNNPGDKPWIKVRKRHGEKLLTLHVPVLHTLSHDEKSKVVAAAIELALDMPELSTLLNNMTPSKKDPE